MSFLRAEQNTPSLAQLPSVQRRQPRAAVAIVPLGDDRVFLKGLTVQALIGVYEHERHAPQPLLVDVEIGMACSRSCASDALADAIDYDAVAQAIRHLAAGNETQLLESFAQTIAATVLADFNAKWIQVDIVKPGVLPGVHAAGVSIKRGVECPHGGKAKYA